MFVPSSITGVGPWPHSHSNPPPASPCCWHKLFSFSSSSHAAKNVILAGVKSITLHDRAEVALRDLGAQFYLSEADVGRNRAEACR